MAFISNNSVPTFIQKLWDILEDRSLNHLLCWSANGTSFIIKDKQKFTEIIPKYFKHSKLASFIRQLNMYNFRKIRGNSEDEFYHKLFRRQKRQLLIGIKRKPSQAQNEYGNQLIQMYETDKQESILSVKKQVKTETMNQPSHRILHQVDYNINIKNQFTEVLQENKTLKHQNLLLWNEYNNAQQKINRDKQKIFKYLTGYNNPQMLQYTSNIHQPFLLHLQSQQLPLSCEEYLFMQNIHNLQNLQNIQNMQRMQTIQNNRISTIILKSPDIIRS